MLRGSAASFNNATRLLRSSTHLLRGSGCSLWQCYVTEDSRASFAVPRNRITISWRCAFKRVALRIQALGTAQHARGTPQHVHGTAASAWHCRNKRVEPRNKRSDSRGKRHELAKQAPLDCCVSGRNRAASTRRCARQSRERSTPARRSESCRGGLPPAFPRQKQLLRRGSAADARRLPSRGAHDRRPCRSYLPCEALALAEIAAAAPMSTHAPCVALLLQLLHDHAARTERDEARLG